MTLREWRGCLVAALLATGGQAVAEDGAAAAEGGPVAIDGGADASPRRPEPSLRLWTAPGGTHLRDSSPYAAGASRAGLAREAQRAELVLRLTWQGTVAEGALRAVTDTDGDTHLEAVPTEIYQELDAAGLHFTVGRKVTSWDVAFGFRPLDVVQQERRLGLRPFAREGIPQVAWEWFDARWALTVLWANPLRGPAALPHHDESVAARGFGTFGPVDLHLVTRFSERTGVQAGAGAAVVAGDALSLHGSVRWQARAEHLPRPAPSHAGSPAGAPARGHAIRWNEVAAVVGATLTPGLGFSILAEGWLDPSGDSPATWRERRRVALQQGAAADAGVLPREAAAGLLASGLTAFDRSSVLRHNVLLRVSRTAGRYEQAVDALCTPADRGWVLTATLARQGERVRLEGGARWMGGPPGAAYRLFPGWASFYVAAQVAY